MGTYRISQLADRVGMPATTLRFYEKVGLLSSQRTTAGYRVYDDAGAERLRFIAAGKHLGLSLDQIRDLLTVWESGACRDVREELQPLVREQVTRATQRRADLGVFVERLTSALAHLQELPARDGRCDPACDFLHDRAHRQPIPVDFTPVPTPSDAHAVDLVPVACSLTADQYGARVQEWRTLLDGAHREILPDGGMRVRLPIARASQLAQLVDPGVIGDYVLGELDIRLEQRHPGLLHRRRDNRAHLGQVIIEQAELILEGFPHSSRLLTSVHRTTISGERLMNAGSLRAAECS
ncbi:MAG: MerR family transcriptional regulator, partial [Actinobacteria bacterium]|nr:MerR family transcriptional regulator [Actinomycetota bacterium]